MLFKFAFMNQFCPNFVRIYELIFYRASFRNNYLLLL